LNGTEGAFKKEEVENGVRRAPGKYFFRERKKISGAVGDAAQTQAATRMRSIFSVFKRHEP
jgi:hypothetical protein